MRCANVEAMWITLSALTPSRSGSGALAAISVLCVCITPFGSPVVPEVKMTSVTSFGSGRSAANSAGSRRCSHGVSMNSCQDGPSTDQHVRQVRPVGAQPLDHGRVVVAAELRAAR